MGEYYSWVNINKKEYIAEYTGIIRTPFRYYTDSVTVLSGFSSGIIRTAF